MTDLLPSTLQTYPVCGVPITVSDTITAADEIIASALAGRSLEVHLCNAYTLSLVDRDERLRTALTHGDLNLADGTPVAWLGRDFGMFGPVRGSHLVGEVARRGNGHLRHYLYGGKDGVADRMAAELRRSVAGCSIVGRETPPFRPLESRDLAGLAARVRDSGANVLWVGLGTPRQDYLVHELAAAVSIPVVPVGAAFDFWSGDIDEAPAVLHGSGLEWLHRLGREPGRLWHRYLVGNPRFVMSAWRHRV